MSDADLSWTVDVPDGTAPDDALSRTTDLAVVAHPDDLELLLPGQIASCSASTDRWFTGIVVTDGAGSVGTDGAATGSEELVARRREEQLAAAALGGHSVVMLAASSSELAATPGREAVRDLVAEIASRCRPSTVYTHAPTDSHRTHVAVASVTIAALRSLPEGRRPTRVLGVEGWRDLDWLPDDAKVRLDVSAHAELAARLAGCFSSQLAHKRYDLAARGRRSANATFAAPREADVATEVTVAMDLTALLDDEQDPAALVGALIDRFRRDVLDEMARTSTNSR